MNFLSKLRHSPEPAPPKAQVDSYFTVVQALDELCRGAINSRSFQAAIGALDGWDVLVRDPRAAIAVQRETRVGVQVTGDEAHVMLAGGSAVNLYFLAFDMWIGKRNLDRSELATARDTLEIRVTHFALLDLVFQFSDQPAMKVVPGEVWSGGAIRIWVEPKRA